ncbi:hypothetical protein ABIB25_001257 [Nakamurella sp. UYEF19]|uniref:hypothetical protein n=1 Tax=Nakamurella sp. UYEF19 TaxID=1756392 RepID=UPI0033970002
MSEPVGRRDRSRALEIRRRVLDSRKHFWHSSDFDAPPSTIEHILGALVGEGELIRVRKGLFWRGAMTLVGMSPPSPMELARQLAGPDGLGLTGLSAANALGVSTQVPRRTHIAVPARAPADYRQVEFRSRPARTGRIAARLTPREVTLLEFLDDPSGSELDAASTWRRIREEIASGRVRPERLASAARTEPAPTRARLTALLGQAGFPDQAKRVPPVDPRTAGRALVSMA